MATGRGPFLAVIHLHPLAVCIFLSFCWRPIAYLVGEFQIAWIYKTRKDTRVVILLTNQLWWNMKVGTIHSLGTFKTVTQPYEARFGAWRLEVKRVVSDCSQNIYHKWGKLVLGLWCLGDNLGGAAGQNFPVFSNRDETCNTSQKASQVTEGKWWYYQWQWRNWWREWLGSTSTILFHAFGAVKGGVTSVGFGIWDICVLFPVWLSCKWCDFELSL